MATLPLPDRFSSRPRRGKLDSEQVALYDRFGIEVPFVRIGNPERRYFRISAQLYTAFPSMNTWPSVSTVFDPGVSATARGWLQAPASK
jgi:hypothetical protein